MGKCRRKPLNCEFWKVEFGEIPPQWVNNLYQNGNVIRSGDKVLIRANDDATFLSEGDFLVKTELGTYHPIIKEYFYELYEEEVSQQYDPVLGYITTYHPSGSISIGIPGKEVANNG